MKRVRKRTSRIVVDVAHSMCRVDLNRLPKWDRVGVVHSTCRVDRSITVQIDERIIIVAPE